MKWTKVLVSILCIICFVSTGHIAEGSGSGQLLLEIPYLARNLPIDWRPTAGSSLSFTVKVTKPPHYSGGRLIATLSEVTNYVGECGNRLCPYNDLELRQIDGFLDPTNPGWRVETAKVSLSHPIGENFTATSATEWITLEVSCEDYAAYGKLTFATGGSSVTEAYPEVIIIPRDINGNKIADGWRDDETTADPNNSNPSKNYAADWDQESGPAAPNTQRGDILGVLDEYRGLYVNGTWTDTDPEGWDVFIRSESGLGYAGSLPGMTPHLMGLNDVDHNEGYVMPYQASSSRLWASHAGHGNVYAIRLKNNPDAYDEQNPDNRRLGYMGIGPPASGTKGEIFTDRIRGTLNPGQTVSGMIDYVAGHEIAHGVHLKHCPNHTDLDCYMWAYTGDVAHHVTQFHSHHLSDYDLKYPAFPQRVPVTIPAGKKRGYDQETGTWSLVDNEGVTELEPIRVTPNDVTPGETNNQNIISTNTGSSSYGCGYNAKYDYCTDTGTCTTRTDATGIGMCGHRWCCCAPATTSVTSTNTGYSSSYGCDYNAEYDYCTDTGTCTTRSGEFGIGMCGHRWCCCAPE